MPGFHNGSLGGALETASAHAAAHAAAQNLYVCGYYCAAAHLRDEGRREHAPVYRGGALGRPVEARRSSCSRLAIGASRIRRTTR